MQVMVRLQLVSHDHLYCLIVDTGITTDAGESLPYLDHCMCSQRGNVDVHCYII